MKREPIRLSFTDMLYQYKYSVWVWEHAWVCLPIKSTALKTTDLACFHTHTHTHTHTQIHPAFLCVCVDSCSCCRLESLPLCPSVCLSNQDVEKAALICHKLNVCTALSIPLLLSLSPSLSPDFTHLALSLLHTALPCKAFCGWWLHNSCSQTEG